MSRRKHRQDASSNKEQPAQSRSESLRPWCLGATVALLVASALVPSEAAVAGASIVLIMGWLVVFAATSLSNVAAEQPRLRFGSVDAAVIIFLVLHTISALIMAQHGQPRQTWNMLWHWVSLGVAFLLMRQLMRTAAEARATVVVMIALAVCLSMHGYYQYFYDLPKTRRHYETDPDAALRTVGLDAPAGSAARSLFEDRLYSTEPIATFTLANSLAGLLAPWLLCASGIGVLSWRGDPRRTRLVIAAALTVLLIVGCLVLTKSRAGWLATICGIAFLMVYGRRTGWRPGWKEVLVVGGGVTGLFVVGVLLGAIDLLVLTESSKSLLYRMQYWRASAAMVSEYPLFGCGPGNFQQYYTAYKLPEASETIADPHNFLFEIWATAGTPALVAFISILGCFLFKVVRYQTQEAPTEKPVVGRDDSVRAVYWGALAGGPVGFGAGLIMQHAPPAAIFVVGFPVAAAIVAAWSPWVDEGELDLLPVAAAILALLINLLVAGGISYAGVSLTLWIGMAVILNHVDGESAWWARSKRAAGVAALVSCALLAGFAYTTYQPVLKSGNELTQAEMSLAMGRVLQAEQQLLAAAAIDPSSADAWRQIASLRHQVWLTSPNERGEAAFRHALQQLLERDRQSEKLRRECGNLFLVAFRRTGEVRHLEEALIHYEIAGKLYPNYNLGQAQIAWTLHLLGRPEAAATAGESLRLDSLNPHTERQLARQQVFDAPPNQAGQPAPPGDRDAEQLMRELRK